MGEPEIIPAATAIVMREQAKGPPELLMVERSAAMSFAGGALVFPGGRVDPGDQALAESFEGDAEDIAARIAAVRETLEEAGLAVGLDLAGGGAAEVGRRSYAGEPLGALLEEAGVTLNLGALVPFARWLPYGMSHRIFDTRFYLARAPLDAAPVVDGSENVRLFWATAQDVLAMAEAGRATVIYPTARNLERLARFASFDEAVADARAHPVRTITPFREQRGGVAHLCIPEDLGYPFTAVPMDRVDRG